MPKIIKTLLKVSEKSVSFLIFNILGIAAIIYLLVQNIPFFNDTFILTKKIFMPFLFGFGAAYVMHPIVEFLKKYKINKNFAVTIVCVAATLVVATFFFVSIPIIYESMYSLYKTLNNSMHIANEWLLLNFNYDITILINSITDNAEYWLSVLSPTSISVSFNIVSSVITIFANMIVYSVITIYMLIEFDNVKSCIKRMFKHLSYRAPHYLTEIDSKMGGYIRGMGLLIVIKTIQYSIVLGLLGHPNWLFLALLLGVSSIVPYIGGVFANIITLITSVGMPLTNVLFLMLAIIVLSNTDNYILSTRILSKTTKLDPLLVLFSVLTGAVLWGIIGVLISIPVLIICKVVYIEYQKDRKISKAIVA